MLQSTILLAHLRRLESNIAISILVLKYPSNFPPSSYKLSKMQSRDENFQPLVIFRRLLSSIMDRLVTPGLKRLFASQESNEGLSRNSADQIQPASSGPEITIELRPDANEFEPQATGRDSGVPRKPIPLLNGEEEGSRADQSGVVCSSPRKKVPIVHEVTVSGVGAGAVPRLQENTDSRIHGKDREMEAGRKAVGVYESAVERERSEKKGKMLATTAAEANEPATMPPPSSPILINNVNEEADAFIQRTKANFRRTSSLEQP
ncbi:hypothetical protein U1Q18_020148 [Sarracenia purpurea var. burkii]